jgi:2'-5' RNA ligase
MTRRKLIGLQRDLTDRLIAAGFSLDKRKYSPHITLGREVVTNAEPWRVEPFGKTVCKIDLMKSERKNGKLTYTVVHYV